MCQMLFECTENNVSTNILCSVVVIMMNTNVDVPPRLIGFGVKLKVDIRKTRFFHKLYQID